MGVGRNECVSEWGGFGIATCPRLADAITLSNLYPSVFLSVSSFPSEDATDPPRKQQRGEDAPLWPTLIEMVLNSMEAKIDTAGLQRYSLLHNARRVIILVEKFNNFLVFFVCDQMDICYQALKLVTDECEDSAKIHFMCG